MPRGAQAERRPPQLVGGLVVGLPPLPLLIVIGASFTTAAVATKVAVSTGVAGHEQGMAAALRQTAFQLAIAVLLSVAASYTQTLLAGTGPHSPAEALTAGYRLGWPSPPGYRPSVP